MAHQPWSFVILLGAAAFGFGASAARPTTAHAAQDIVRLEPGAAVHLATPPFLVIGKRYAFTWPGGGPSQTYTIKAIQADGWVLVDVADENTRPELYVPGEFPTRWLHVGLAVSVQEMRPLS